MYVFDLQVTSWWVQLLYSLNRALSPPDLIDFINSAGGNGFIIVSFGSYVQTIISKEKIDIMASAFGKLKQNVIWKLKGNRY